MYNLPKGVTLSADKQSLYVMEATNTCIRRINLTSLADSIFAGTPGTNGNPITFSKLGANSLVSGVGQMWL
jgi:hypothetical protein